MLISAFKKNRRKTGIFVEIAMKELLNCVNGQFLKLGVEAAKC